MLGEQKVTLALEREARYRTVPRAWFYQDLNIQILLLSLIKWNVTALDQVPRSASSTKHHPSSLWWLASPGSEEHQWGYPLASQCWGLTFSKSKVKNWNIIYSQLGVSWSASCAAEAAVSVCTSWLAFQWEGEGPRQVCQCGQAEEGVGEERLLQHDLEDQGTAVNHDAKAKNWDGT